MRKVIIGFAIITCVIMTSCGNMNQVFGSLNKDTGAINAITSIIGLDKIKSQNLIATWKYEGPGCAFTSKNLLAKAGGEIGAVQIEKKLSPYYQQIGLSANNTYITFKEDGSFTSNISGVPFTGKYTFEEETQKITLKGLLFSTNCYVKKEANGISILFEAKKLLTILQTMSAMSNDKKLQTIGDLSKNYEGVRIGFDMKR